MPQSQFDTLILGQGLAGSALAWRLIAAGQRVCVIDDGHRSCASAVAAGLINPLAGMRFGHRPELADWLAGADHWYAELAQQFGRIFFHQLPMLRLFRSPQQQRFHAQRAADASSRDLIGAPFTSGQCPEPIVARHGGFIQRRTGYVDLPLLLASVRDWLRGRDCLVEGALAPEQIDVQSDGIRALGLHARRLVLCDGARLHANPWFSTLPLRPEKGEILDLVTDDWQPRHIINGAYWLVPLQTGGLRFGATHEHRQIDQRISAAARAQLLAGMRALRPDAAAPRVLRQQAGIRPATGDRYPLIGQHPRQPALWVFNGFGARGALTIPWYAQCLTRHLLNGVPLPAEADIRRFA